MAIVSVVIQRDAWPGGWYNCRTDFLGRTSEIDAPFPFASAVLFGTCGSAEASQLFGQRP